MDLLEVNELLQKGVGAETILKILQPMVELRQRGVMARLVQAKELQDFLEIQAETKVVLSILSQLDSLASQAKSLSDTAGAARRR